MSKFESSIGQLNEDLGVQNEIMEKEELLSYEEMSELTDTFKEGMHLGDSEASAAPQSMLDFKIAELEKSFGKKCREYQTYYILLNKPVDTAIVVKKDFPGKDSVIDFINNL